MADDKPIRDKIDAQTAQVSTELLLSGTEGQLALLCGVCEALISNAERTGTMSAGDMAFLKATLTSLPWYQEWRGDGGLKCTKNRAVG